MIKTVVTPQDNQLILHIPSAYLGKKVEILLYALDEVEEEKKNTPNKSLSDYRGFLSESDYQSLNRHIQQIRNEWDRDI